MKIASFKLPEDLDRALTAMAQQKRISRSAVVRQALEQLASAPRRSAADLAGKLVGCLDGPADLSTAARHLEDFGK